MRKSIMRKALALVIALAMVAVMPLAAFAGTDYTKAAKQGKQSLNKGGVAVESINNSALNGADSYNDDTYKFTRLAGSSRYNTAATVAGYIMGLYQQSVSNWRYNSTITANGANYPDALGAGGLAFETGACIMLTSPSLNDEIAQVTCQMLLSTKESSGTFIMGGTGAVSSTFETSFKKYRTSNQEYLRIAGSSRYDTNIKTISMIDDCEYVLICSGKGYADSLSASATGWPILLVGDSLTNQQKTWLTGYARQHGMQHIRIIGGTGAVNQTVEKQIRNLGVADVGRVAGSSRYETSYLIAKSFFGDNAYNGSVVLAYAQNYPDGLSGAPLCFEYGAPLILCDSAHMSYVKKFTDSYNSQYAVVLGGPKLISDSAVKGLRLYENWG